MSAPPPPLHAWDVTPSAAVALQRVLATRLVTDVPLALDGMRAVAGVDVSVKDGVSRAAVVVCAFPGLAVLEAVTASQPTPFPYISGLLSFREGPVLLEAFARLTHTPDAYLFDGMGIMHPRRIGIAAHMGLWLNAPTVGVGKTHLLGRYDPPGPARGDASPVTDRGEAIGVVLRTRPNVRPVYVSPGHRIDTASAVALVLACTTRYRLPEPIRAAHTAAGAFESTSADNPRSAGEEGQER